MVIYEHQGTQLQSVRELEQEEKQAHTLVQHCPTLQRNQEHSWEWTLASPDDCLDALLELKDIDQKTVKTVLEWPEGEKFKLLAKASLNHFHLQIKQQQDWFYASGKIQIDDQLVIEMRDLLKQVSVSSGRFLEIKDGQFIALTQEFQKRLQALERYSETHDKGVRFHPFASLALEGLTDGVGQLKTDTSWDAHVKNLQRLDEEINTGPPSTLQAELRGYQLEGFAWLSRLSNWGVGACLADDMGLGKTIQAISMLLKHAPNGPSLVIAPSSVCMNWLEEVKRFAPTLKISQLGKTKRKEQLEALDKFDILICS